MKVTKKTFGILSNGKKVRLYKLEAGELALCLSTLGAAWTSLVVPSRNGKKDDILLGYDTFDGFAGDSLYFGITVGRFANRIGGAKFSLEGKEFALSKNDGANCLHGGRRGFGARLWDAEAYEEKNGIFVRFELKSPDGEEGFPGEVKAAVSYGLTKSNELVISYEAKTDAPCPVSLTNHAYYNLAGEGNGDILSTEMRIFASSYLENGDGILPTGKILPVKDTPFDFTARKSVGRDLPEGGYDNCYVLDGEPGELRPCAEVFEPLSGRTMRCFTTQPGVQFYSGNKIPSMRGKNGSLYGRHSGFCLETEHFPDSPNNPEFPSAIFSPGRDYHEKAVFAFDW
jgi:aldose 1-epimerase